MIVTYELQRAAFNRVGTTPTRLWLNPIEPMKVGDRVLLLDFSTRSKAQVTAEVTSAGRCQRVGRQCVIVVEVSRRYVVSKGGAR